MIMVFILSLAAATILFPVEEASRPWEEKTLDGKRMPLVTLGDGGTHRIQYDVHTLWLGAGWGTPPGGGGRAVNMMILNGRAFLRNDGGPADSRALVDIEQAVAIPMGARPTAVFLLPPGRPVPLTDLKNHLAARVREDVFFLGIGELADAPGWKGVRGILVGFPELRPDKDVFWLEMPVPFAPVMTPEEMVAAARAGCARTAPTLLTPGLRLREATVYVWEFAGTRPGRETAVDPPMVDLGVSAPQIMLDVRYATTSNFTGQVVYPVPRCMLVQPAAERLVRVNQRVMQQGYRLKVYDGYRPTSAHWRLWELADNKDYLANPWSGSRHSRGAAVDLTLVTMDGRPVEMPTEFDTFSEKAHRSAPMSETARYHLDILTRAMQAEGFSPIQSEWWHFDYLGWANCPLRDIPLD